jgi:hypothetical protein
VAGAADDYAREMELQAVQQELEDLVSARGVETLSAAEQGRYEALCARERELIDRSERTPDTDS